MPLKNKKLFGLFILAVISSSGVIAMQEGVTSPHQQVINIGGQRRERSCDQGHVVVVPPCDARRPVAGPANGSLSPLRLPSPERVVDSSREAVDWTNVSIRDGFIADLLRVTLSPSTPLFHVQLVQGFLSGRFDISSFRSTEAHILQAVDTLGRTGLHMVALLPWANPDECIELAHRLVCFGVNSHALDFGGMTSLHLAVARKNYALVNFLLEKTQDRMLFINRCVRGMSALHLAIMLDDREMIDILIRAGVDLQSLPGYSLVDWIKQLGFIHLFEVLGIN